MWGFVCVCVFYILKSQVFHSERQVAMCAFFVHQGATPECFKRMPFEAKDGGVISIVCEVCGALALLLDLC